MNPFFFLTLIVGLTNHLTAFAQADPLAGKLIIPNGPKHGDEVSAKNGELWLALVATKDSHALVKTPIGVKAVFDAVLDNEGQKTGKEISARSKAGPVLFWLKAADLKPTGKVFSAMKDLNDTEIELRLSQSIPMTVGSEANCSLEVNSTVAPENSSKLINYKVTYQCGKAKQVLEDYPQTENPPALLIWWGDLNGDKKPDLILKKVSHENVSRLVLYLSSSSTNGKSLKAVAISEATGC